MACIWHAHYHKGQEVIPYSLHMLHHFTIIHMVRFHVQKVSQSCLRKIRHVQTVCTRPFLLKGPGNEAKSRISPLAQIPIHLSTCIAHGWGSSGGVVFIDRCIILITNVTRYGKTDHSQFFMKIAFGYRSMQNLL